MYGTLFVITISHETTPHQTYRRLGMKHLNLLVLGAALVGLTASSVFAGIGDRAKNQRHRIAQGARSGELTRHETKKLAKQQRRIRRQAVKARQDGQVTPRERRHLNRMQNRADRQIYKEKHDHQTRGGK
jgi:uncharacterized protein HemX